MRIVAGTAKGRPLLGPKKKQGIRPTADRVRETLFNVLGQWMGGLSVLDLYAGTGALGLEALSRGASSLLSVDADPDAVALCQQNGQSLGFSDRMEVWSMKVQKALSQLSLSGRRFDLIFADPPYVAKAAVDLLQGVGQGLLLSPGGTLVIEHDKREKPPEELHGLIRADQRKFGDTLASLYRWRT